MTELQTLVLNDPSLVEISYLLEIRKLKAKIQELEDRLNNIQLIPGESGEVGAQGESGEQGEVGSQGERGLRGFKGEKGDQGAPGVNGIDGKSGKSPKIDDIIEKIKKEKLLEMRDIKNMPLNMSDLRWHGSGSSTSVLAYDLSNQLDGVTKVFTIPSNRNIVAVNSSSAPFSFRPLVDYTGSGSVTLTFDALIDAPSMLAQGQTLILLYTS